MRASNASERSTGGAPVHELIDKLKRNLASMVDLHVE
jgi:hypothetical protein